MFSNFVTRQPRRPWILSYHLALLVIVLTGTAILVLAKDNSQPAAGGSRAALTSEPDISWPVDPEPSRVGGLTRYEISNDSTLEITFPTRFVF